MYSRELDGRILTLNASGWTYNDTFVLYDFETESMWYHRLGDDAMTCIAGELADRMLEELPAYKVRWSTWVKSNPDSKILACKFLPLVGCQGY